MDALVTPLLSIADIRENENKNSRKRFYVYR